MTQPPPLSRDTARDPTCMRFRSIPESISYRYIQLPPGDLSSRENTCIDLSGCRFLYALLCFYLYFFLLLPSILSFYIYLLLSEV
jgi:hypothetical protein